MNIWIAPTEREFYQLAARKIAEVMVSRPNAVIGLATGRTTTGIHQALAELWQTYRFDTSHITVFGMDEVTGVPRTYFGSCYDMLLTQVVKPLHIPMENYLMPPTIAPDLLGEGRAFMRAIKARGGIDLQVLGIGENGHLGFNQPGTPLDSEVLLGEMDERLNKRIHEETGIPMTTHLGGVTLGIKDIMQARRILLCANGNNKSEIVRDALYGSVTPQLPASVLQLHPFAEAVLDPDAARLLGEHGGMHQTC